MNYALIFDMDGVVIDSNPYHKISWKNFLDKRGIPFNDQIFDEVISGRTGNTSLPILFGKELSEDVTADYVMEIDSEFQEILRQSDDAAPLAGLQELLESARSSGIKTALATSAPPGNVNLTMDKLNFRHYFDVIIDKTEVVHGKPDPEVYLKTLDKLGVETNRCIVFEDSKSGIKSALAAGLRVIGVSTGHSRELLLEEGVSMVIEDFRNLNLEDMFQIMHLNN